MITLELFNPHKHYEVICEWWKSHEWPVIPLSHLPLTGLVVYSDGTPSAAGFIYKTDSAFCLFEYIVANPEVRKDARASALSALISSAKILSKTMGFQTIFMSIRNASLGSRLEKQGFISTDQNMTNYICNLEVN